jgi:hypothetical protein
MSWLNPGRWLLIGGLLAALWLGYGAWAAHQQGIGEARATATYNAAIDKQKTKAGQLLQAETDRANAATSKLIELKTEREKQDVENKSTIAALAVRLRAAAGPAARLRDPHAAGCGSCGGSAPATDPARAEGGAADGAEAGGLLSKQLTEFLLTQAADADQVNLAYTSCRLDALSLREVLR